MATSLLAPTGQPSPMQPGDFQSAAQAAVVTWQTKRLAPPSHLYVTVDDVLHVTAASSQANETVTVSYRLLRAADGAIVFGQMTISPASNRTVKAADNQLAEGWLLSVSCQAAVATSRGQTFVRVMLNPKSLGSGQPGLMMMSDYVTTAMAPAYPNGRALAPSEGPGFLRTTTFAAPGAGADFVWGAPTNARWRIISMLARLATSAVVANRLVTLGVTGSGAIIWEAMANQVIPANSQPFVSAGAVTPGGAIGLTAVNVPIPPDVTLINGGGMFSTTVNLDAGDNWLAQQVLVEEWLDNV